MLAVLLEGNDFGLVLCQREVGLCSATLLEDHRPVIHARCLLLVIMHSERHLQRVTSVFRPLSLPAMTPKVPVLTTSQLRLHLPDLCEIFQVLSLSTSSGAWKASTYVLQACKGADAGFPAPFPPRDAPESRLSARKCIAVPPYPCNYLILQATTAMGAQLAVASHAILTLKFKWALQRLHWSKYQCLSGFYNA